jgi:hypothetical protein
MELIISHKQSARHKRTSIQLIEDDGKVRNFTIRAESNQFDSTVLQLSEANPSNEITTDICPPDIEASCCASLL